MGTSNKRDKEGAFAGRFGEGFKVAARSVMTQYFVVFMNCRLLLIVVLEKGA